MEQEHLTFKAIINKMQTNPDGGWRVTFDVSESDNKAMLILAQLRNSLLQIAAVQIIDDDFGEIHG